MKTIEVKKTIHIEYEYPPLDAEKTPATKNFLGTFVDVRSDGYISARKPVLEQCICHDWVMYLQRSEDNGKTWQRFCDWDYDNAWYLPQVWDNNPATQNDEVSAKYAVKEKGIVKFSPQNFVDPEENLLIRTYGQEEHGIDADPAVKGSMFEGMLTMKSNYEISRDEGLTWSGRRQFIQKGPEYDEEHWARDITCGKQGGGAGGCFLKLKNGEILTTLNRFFNRDNELCENVACLLGRWNEDRTDIDWELGEYVNIDQRLSSSGLSEPSVAQLSDGRLFMIMRATKSLITNLPSFKYYAVSEDNARTWSPAKVLTYPDGSVIYSPACYPTAFCSSRNGRLYIITNLLDKAPWGSHDPRHPLQIAGVDQEKFCVIPETVTVIEDRKPELGQPEGIRFSNWNWHEDRGTKDIVLYMTSCTQTGIRPPDCGCPMHSYRYDIRLPQ